jgi:hypothetical protein
MNLYMFSGGTNWRLEAGLHADGAPRWQTGPYVPGGPLSEAGDFTDLGREFCAVLATTLGRTPPVLPPVAPKSDYGGIVRMTAVAPLWAALPLLTGDSRPPTPFPETFEVMGMESGYAVYEAWSRLQVR